MRISNWIFNRKNKVKKLTTNGSENAATYKDEKGEEIIVKYDWDKPLKWVSEPIVIKLKDPSAPIEVKPPVYDEKTRSFVLDVKTGGKKK